jgi:transcription termination/antitermination protein NusG
MSDETQPITESTEPTDTHPEQVATPVVAETAEVAEVAVAESSPADTSDSAASDTTEPATVTVKIKKPRTMPKLDEIPDINAPVQLQWYILKVATNREDSIRDALKRKVAMEGLDKYFGDVLVPTELITEFKNGKKRTTKRKLFPGYIVVQMEINDDSWYAVRETSGIGDFTGAMGRPAPMSAADIAKIIPKAETGTPELPKTAIKFKQGDKVRIKEGTFANFEGSIEVIDDANGRVTVMVSIFGRTTPVDIEYWQVETVD